MAVTILPSPESVPDELYYDGDITVTHVTAVEGEVGTILWRSAITQTQIRKPFHFSPSAVNVLQTDFALSTSQGSKVTDSYSSKDEDIFGLLVVGTRERLYFYDGYDWWFEWVSVWYNGLGGVIDGVPTSLAVGNGGEIYVANNVSLTRININYTFDRIGPLEGLPYNQINALCHIDYTPSYPHPTHPSLGYSDSLGSLWVGTGKGYALFDTGTAKFKGYFYGPRWHSGEKILSITETSGGGVVMLTDKGLTFVTPEVWTLAKKAEHYQSMLKRHTREPGGRS